MAKKAAPKKPKTLQIKIIGPVAAKFSLSHNIGDVVEMEYNQASALIEFDYAILAE